MTKKTTLTRADYQERKASLDVLLTEARSHHAQAAYRQEMGDGDQAEVDKAIANVSELQSRAANLNAAWEVAQREHAVEIEAADFKSRKESLAQITSSIADRAKAITAIANTIDQLAPLIAEIRAAEESIIAAARPHMVPGDVGDLRVTLAGFGSIHDKVAACCLMKAGFNLRFMIDSSETQQYLDDGLDARLAFTEKVIRGAVKSVAPAEELA